MKKLITTSILTLCFSYAVFSQTRLLEVNEALAKVGLTKIQMASFLKDRGYKFLNSYNGCYSYSKYDNAGEHNLSVCYKGSKVNALGWNELYSYINVVAVEVDDLGFKRQNRDGMLAFHSDKYMITVIPRQQTKDIFISIGYKSK